MCKIVGLTIGMSLIWSMGLYCFLVAWMYNNLGTLEYYSTLNPIGATSVLHLTQAYIKGRDILGTDILIKYPMLPYVEMKSQGELSDWIADTLSSPTTVYITKKGSNKHKIAYISSPPHFIFINMFPWLLMGSYLILSGTYNIFRIYVRYIKKDYQKIPDLEK